MQIAIMVYSLPLPPPPGLGPNGAANPGPPPAPPAPDGGRYVFSRRAALHNPTIAVISKTYKKREK